MIVIRMITFSLNAYVTPLEQPTTYFAKPARFKIARARSSQL